MENYIQEALDIVKTQAGIRTMSEEEIVAMVKNLAAGIRSISEDSPVQTTNETIDPQKAIKERSVSCLCCGKTFKVLTQKHLASHGLTHDEYCERFGYPKNTTFACKGLRRARRKTMEGMKLWERRGKKKTLEEGLD